MAKATTLCVVLFGFWLALSGHYTPFLLLMGALSSAFCVALVSRMGIIDAETVPLQIKPALPLYWLWLGWEIVKANVDVAKIILSRRMPLAQQFVHVAANQKTEMGRVIFANSITLTPGTVTVETSEGGFLVHALSPAFTGSLPEMDARVSGVERA
jgi:multicomponent Na+:H+ antiporter subunit E